MTKQEEIREGVARIISEDYDLPECRYSLTRDISRYLDSVGVVLKVDRELPTRFLLVLRSLQEAYEQAERDMLKAGYVATEPLV